MKRSLRFSLAGVSLLAALLWTSVASAHPLGNFTINHYAGLQLSPQAVSVDYVLDMAEIPAFQTLDVIDTNRNGTADPAETAVYHPAACAALASQLALRVQGEAVPVAVAASSLELPAGAGGLPTLRLTCALSAPLALTTERVRVEFEDGSYVDRLGWREIMVTADQVTLAGDFATESLSQRLSAYPDDLLNSPLDQRRVALDVTAQPDARPVGGSGAEPSGTLSPLPGRSDRFTQLITLQEFSLPAIALALVVAFVWGAMHALTPGHGKTIVGAYLVGSRGTARHALYLGLTTTLTHTAGVFVLGLAVLAAANFVRAEQLYPWLSAGSGLLVAGLGVSLLVRRLRGVAALALPAHTHPHTHDGHTHTHDHGHTHLPPGAEAPITWRSLLGLGISGGLLPCPSALVVMLSAVALDRIGFGLLLIVTFSLGLASVLTGIGLAFIYAGRLFDQRLPQTKAVRLLPAASALFIALAGVALTWQAFTQLGLL